MVVMPSNLSYSRHPLVPHHCWWHHYDSINCDAWQTQTIIQQLECPPRQSHRLTDVVYRCQGCQVLYEKFSIFESSAIFLRARILQRKSRARCVRDVIPDHYMKSTIADRSRRFTAYKCFLSACRVRVTICHEMFHLYSKKPIKSHSIGKERRKTCV